MARVGCFPGQPNRVPAAHGWPVSEVGAFESCSRAPAVLPALVSSVLSAPEGVCEENKPWPPAHPLLSPCRLRRAVCRYRVGAWAWEQSTGV